MMRYSEKTRRLWRMMLAYHRDRPGVLQQPALNQLLRGATVAKLAIRVQGLNESIFLSGFCFYEQRPLSAHHIEADNVVGVHHNWLKGDHLKWLRAIAFDAIANGSAGFLAQARTTMATKVSYTVYASAPARNCTLLPRTHGGRVLAVCRRNSQPRLCHGHTAAALWSCAFCTLSSSSCAHRCWCFGAAPGSSYSSQPA